jgi:hypothetical protein
MRLDTARSLAQNRIAVFMSAVFRHMTLRLWVTAIAGGLFCTLLLPQWQRIAGLQGMWIPVTAILGGCFVLTGYLMNKLGMLSIRRQIAEAAVWERAGLSDEAEGAFERAKALYDSFWLSPSQRRRSADWIVMRLARFYLNQPDPGRSSGDAIASYLQLHPEDEAVALGWLERMLQKENHSHAEHDTAVRISEALPEHDHVQRLLLQFYLSNERSDFEAMQTYRRVWQSGNELPAATVHRLVRLLINEECINDWALKVYLYGFNTGDELCLEGIAASIRQLRPTAENRADLVAAGIILAGLDEGRRKDLLKPIESFEPVVETEMEGTDDFEARSLPMESTVLRQRLVRSGTAFLIRAGTAGNRLLSMIDRIRRRLMEPRMRRAIVGCIMAGAFVVTIAVMIRSASEKPVLMAPAQETLIQPQAPVQVPEPSYRFTIQVAAYLKPQDAQAYVDRLKQQKIDAYSTRATGANRTWYQVKVSKFTTRDEARTYGESLKAQWIIDDFYVANFTP